MTRWVAKNPVFAVGERQSLLSIRQSFVVNAKEETGVYTPLIVEKHTALSNYSGLYNIYISKYFTIKLRMLAQFEVRFLSTAMGFLFIA